METGRKDDFKLNEDINLENIFKEYEEFCLDEIVLDNYLLGAFISGKYFVTKTIKEELVKGKKILVEKNDLEIKSILKTLLKNYKLILNFSYSDDNRKIAELYLIEEIEGKELKTFIADYINEKSVDFKKDACIAFNIVEEDEEKANEEIDLPNIEEKLILIELMKSDDKEFVIEMSSEIFVLNMLKELSKCGEIGKIILEDYKEKVENKKYTKGGVKNLYTKLRKELDIVVNKHGGYKEIIGKNKEIIVPIKDFTKPVKEYVQSSQKVDIMLNKVEEKKKEIKEEKKKEIKEEKKLADQIKKNEGKVLPKKNDEKGKKAPSKSKALSKGTKQEPKKVNTPILAKNIKKDTKKQVKKDIKKQTKTVNKPATKKDTNKKNSKPVKKEDSKKNSTKFYIRPIKVGIIDSKKINKPIVLNIDKQVSPKYKTYQYSEFKFTKITTKKEKEVTNKKVNGIEPFVVLCNAFEKRKGNLVTNNNYANVIRKKESVKIKFEERIKN